MTARRRSNNPQAAKVNQPLAKVAILSFQRTAINPRRGFGAGPLIRKTISFFNFFFGALLQILILFTASVGVRQEKNCISVFQWEWFDKVEG